MRHPQRVLGFALAAALLSACGGGGQAGSIPSSSGSTTGTGGTSASKTPLATATLTIKGSPYFHTASKAKGSTSSSRRPAYVNSNGNYLDVWVITQGNVATHVVDSSGGSNINLNGQNSDGTQTFQIPLYSTTVNEIVAYETDGPFGTNTNQLLAIGESDLGNIVPGSAPTLSMTMLMNATRMGVMSDPNDANDDALVQGAGGGTSWAEYPCTSNFYFFDADPTGGFIFNTGVGGTTVPTVTGSTSDVASPVNKLNQNPGVNGGYSITFNNGGGLTVLLTTVNPAYAIVQQFQPGISFLRQNSSATDPMFPTYYNVVFSAGPAFNITAFDILPPGGC